MDEDELEQFEEEYEALLLSDLTPEKIASLSLDVGIKVGDKVIISIGDPTKQYDINLAMIKYKDYVSYVTEIHTFRSGIMGYRLSVTGDNWFWYNDSLLLV